jgi:predicted Zn-dependent protease
MVTDTAQPVAEASVRAEADRVWNIYEKGDNIEAGRQGGALVDAADFFRSEGKLEQACEYYRRAGLVRPWDLDAKERYAEVLQQLGDTVAARDVAGQVQALAETDKLQEASHALLGGVPPQQLPAPAALSPNSGETILILVPGPGGRRWLLNEAGTRLSARLGIRVGVATGYLGVGAADRTGRSRLVKHLRKNLPWTDPRLAVFMPSGKGASPEDLSDDEVIGVMERLCQQDGGKAKLAAFNAALAEADRQLQWDADRLLDVLAREYPDHGKPRVVYLAVLPMDLYSGTANFLFGSALENGNYAVVSYERFTASFTDEPPNRERLVERITKQLLSSFGFAIGVPRCADPRCARSYSRSLNEHDAKGAGLCSDCRSAFAKALGYELPTQPDRSP